MRMGITKPAAIRADEVIQKFLDWKARNKSAANQRDVMRALICEAIDMSERAMWGRLKKVHWAGPSDSFPFSDHRTLAQVDQTKELA